MLVVLGIIRALISKNSTVSDSSKNVQSLNRAMMDAAKPSLIAQILTGLLIICFVIIMIILLYRLAVRIIKILLSKYTQDTDIILTLKADAKETKKIENEQTLTERIKHFFAKTYEEKIRQAYRMKILSYKELKINDSDTAKMIARNVETQYEENIDKLTNVYEKARYGNEKVSPEEAEEGGIIC